MNFSLAEEDGWPPVSTECLPFESTIAGYRALAAPLFVKELSIDDVIVPRIDANGFVTSWDHVFLSENTTVWLLRLAQTTQIEGILEKLRDLGCDTSCADSLGCSSISVSKAISMKVVDELLATLSPDQVAVAFPSFRHPQ